MSDFLKAIKKLDKEEERINKIHKHKYSSKKMKKTLQAKFEPIIAMLQLTYDNIQFDVNDKIIRIDCYNNSEIFYPPYIEVTKVKNKMLEVKINFTHSQNTSKIVKENENLKYYEGKIVYDDNGEAYMMSYSNIKTIIVADYLNAFHTNSIQNLILSLVEDAMTGRI